VPDAVSAADGLPATPVVFVFSKGGFMHPVRNTLSALILLAVTIVVAHAADIPPVKATTADVTVFEFYNTTLKHYFRTAVVAEANAIDAGAAGPGWQRTGLNFTASAAGTGSGNDVCRFYNPVANTHFYTADADECAAVKKDPGWRYEELSFRIVQPVGGVCAAGSKPVYRTYNNLFAVNDSNHRFMTTLATYTEMTGQGWRGEGIVMCALNDGPLTDITATAGSTLSGTVNAMNVTIPAGVTVNVTGDLALNATGIVNIAGNLVGDCRAMAVVASGRLDITGTVDNHCVAAPAGAAPALTLVGYGGYRFGGRIASHGDVLVTNDPSLPRASGVAAGDAVTRTPAISPVIDKALAVDYACTSFPGSIWFNPPASAPNGANGGAEGRPGEPGAKRTLGCRGNGLVDSSSLIGQHGGNGGTGTDSRNADVNAKGGAGGVGGELYVHVTGQIDFVGVNVLNSGNGGDGGAATATALPNDSGGTAPSATATGGRGGNAGLITVRADGGITVAGALQFNVGRGGQGGDARATGAAGANSTAAKDAQIGGAASATGGDGGSSPSRQLEAGGNVPGVGNVIVSGGDGGRSGQADATGGKGGDGVVRDRPAGARGGNVTAVGGQGGNAGIRNLAGALVGTGGASADAIFTGGNGGEGFNDCAAPLVRGGVGGAGALAAGGNKAGGTGAANGATGVARLVNLGNGGKGGHGLGPGNGGAAGGSAIAPVGGPAMTPPVFTAGAKGRGCRFLVAIAVASDPAPPHEGFVNYTTITILDALVDNQAGIVAFSGIAGGRWISVSGPFDATTGAFSASGAGTAAGIANVPVLFTGTINLATGAINGTVTLAGNASTPPNGLPGHATSYNVTGNVQGVTPP
jgi:hypothetical protein